MKLVSFNHRNRHGLGVIVEDQVHVIASSDTLRMHELIRRGVTPTHTSLHYPLSEVTFNAPLRPGKIVAIGRNYAEHAAETGSDLPDKPLIFAIFPSAVIGPGEAITWSESITKEVDWEVELAVIIGKRASKVSEEEALNYVFGYTIGNDVSARDLQLRIDGQWTRGKSLDTFCPLGPIIVTRDEIADPQKLKLSLKVNDEVRQDSSTEHMVFGVAHLIHYISQSITLEPGDVIMSGTPSGVGQGMDPKVFLKDGDVVTCTIEGIGELSNPCKILEEVSAPE
jgi:5-carboxymethyl-2-hydroxymuconate isomerase